jgi:hypothetical protein
VTECPLARPKMFFGRSKTPPGLAASVRGRASTGAPPRARVDRCSRLRAREPRSSGGPCLPTSCPSLTTRS